MLHQFITTRDRMPVEHLKEPPLPLPPLIISHYPLLSLAVTLTGIICKDQRSSYALPVAETKHKDQNPLLGWWPIALPSLLPIFPFLYPSSSSCPDWPWPSAQEQVLAGFAGQTGVGRQTTQYRLGADRDGVGEAWWEEKGVNKRREMVAQRWRDSSKGS